MESYTAKQVTEVLQVDDPEMNLRTVRYYTQIGIIPPLELIGNKRMYTSEHISYFRAILTLSLSGESLASIQEKLQKISVDEIKKIGDHLQLYKSKQMLTNDTHVINEDVIISMSPRISAELRARMVDTVSQMLKEDME